MINFSNYYCLVIVLIVKITTCQTNDPNTTVIEIENSNDVCELPIDEGECRNESLVTDEGNGDNDVSDNNELNEKTFYFGYNKSTKKCEQFYYDGCGGNANRFDTVNECRKTCYTPLKNFLAKVTDLLVFRVTNGSKGHF